MDTVWLWMHEIWQNMYGDNTTEFTKTTNDKNDNYTILPI